MTVAAGIETGAGGASGAGGAGGLSGAGGVGGGAGSAGRTASGFDAGGPSGSFRNAGFVAFLHSGLPSGLRNSEPASGGNFRSNWQAQLAALGGGADDSAALAATDTSLTGSLLPRPAAARLPLGSATPANAPSIGWLPSAGQSPSVLAGLRAHPAEASPEIAVAASELPAHTPKGTDSASHALSHSSSHAKSGSSSSVAALSTAAALVGGAGNASIAGTFISVATPDGGAAVSKCKESPGTRRFGLVASGRYRFRHLPGRPVRFQPIGKASGAAAVAAWVVDQDASAPVSAGEDRARAGHLASTADAAPDALSAAAKQDAFAGERHGEAASPAALSTEVSGREITGVPAAPDTQPVSPTTPASAVQDQGQVESPAAPSAGQEARPPGLPPQPQSPQAHFAQPDSLTVGTSGHTGSQDARLDDE